MEHNKTLSTILFGAVLLGATTASAQTARVQIIHNCADAAAATVDIYVNDEITLEDVAFRTATAFLDLPAEVDLAVGIAPGNSTGPDDIIATFDYNLPDGGSFIIVANGIVSPTGYAPVQPFNLDVFPAARESAAMSMNTDVLVVHGSTDAPVVDVAETSVPAGTVVDDIAYSEFAGYLELGTADYVLEVQLADGTPVVAYDAPLATLGLDGAAITVLASGFLAPANNSNGPAFGLWVALATGGELIPLPLAAGDQTARVQIIHNCADAAAAVVDIYVNEVLTLPDVAFRTATAFLDLPAETDLAVGIAPGNSTGPADIIASFDFNLDANGSYIVVANGIVSATGYTPAQPFTLDVFAAAQEEAAVATNTDVLVMHGSTDAPVVDVAEISVPAGTIVNDLAYGSFAGYLELGTADYAIQVQTSTGAPVATYAAPLATLNLDGAALTVLASGFLDPGVNSNGPAFGLYVALPAGGALIPLPLITNVGVDEANDVLSFTAWPNPASDLLNLNIDAAEAFNAIVTLTDMTGRIALQVSNAVVNGDENRMTIDLGALAEGLYTMSVSSNNGIRTAPIQVVR